MKFGGTSVKDGKNILYCTSLVKKYANENEIVVVVSAMAGVTDALINAAQKCSKEPSAGYIKMFTADMMKKHYEAVEYAVKSEDIKNKVIYTLEKLFDELERVLLGISYLGELTKRSEDYIVSFGERLIAPIFSASLISLGVDSVALTGGDAGIITDKNYGRAKPIPGVYNIIKSRIEPLIKIKKTVPVVTGFIGAADDGSITTLGRGGSDYSATIIAAAIDADEVWLWKEVDGIMTADPKYVPNARLIPEISYFEAMELSHFGAKILHPRALEPVMKKDIPVRIKNTFNPDSQGTVVRDKIENKGDVVKALSLIEVASIINVRGAGLDFAETMSEVFRMLAENKINVIMVAQSSSELNLSIVVDQKDAEKAYKILKSLENGMMSVRKIDNVSIVSAVGAGMAGTPGVAGRIFSALGRNKINVVMISQSCSEYNISFAVDSKDGVNALKIIHDEFKLGSS